jgi:hypothetical protein
MRRIAILLIGMAAMAAACGRNKDPDAKWFSSPTQVVQGVMHAYETRNDTLFADFLAEDFRYFFEPQVDDSVEVLGWGKEEEVASTGSLFRTPDVVSIKLDLRYDDARAAPQDRPGWMVVPISGGELVVSLKDKDPMQVTLNRQEILVRPRAEKESGRKWEIVEWHDYPNPNAPAGGGGTPAGS